MKFLRFAAAGALFQVADVVGIDSVSTGRPGYGFIGYGISMFQPACAFGCKDTISPLLNCTMKDMGGDHMDGMMMKRMGGMGGSGDNADLPSGNGWMVMSPTSECMAENDYFLQTIAYCVNSRCSDVPVSTLEGFWARDALGRSVSQPLPKLSYQLALQAALASSPTRKLNNSILLNYTAVVTDDQYTPNFNADANFEEGEVTHERYALVLFLTGAIIPIGLSLLRFLPWPAWLVSRVNASLIDPPLIGSKHSTPIWGLGMMPTRGQALFIAYLWIVNVMLSASGFDIIWPHAWYSDKASEVVSYLGNRVGILSFANLGLVALYAGRNNVLLWVTDWSHSTFLLLHRWIAVICTLQASLHSAIYLQVYLATEGYDYAIESRLPYWYCGIFATLSLVLLIPISVRPVRQRVYEAFLASHVALAIIALIGCLLHILYRYDRQWGYETWIYMAAAIWAFDRLARLARTLRAGVRRAYITTIDENYYRVDIPGVSCTGHAYLHFPTLSTWRFWENHPFSVASVTRRPLVSRIEEATGTTRIQKGEKAAAVTETPQEGYEASSSDSPPAKAASEIGTTFFIRKNNGITARLDVKDSSSSIGVAVLVEASYGTGMTFLRDDEVIPTHEYPNILCIAGGVGITPLLPILDRFNNLKKPIGTAKLYWGARSQPLVRAVEDVLRLNEDGGYAATFAEPDATVPVTGAAVQEKRWGNVQVTLSVGERLNLRSILETELRQQQGGTTVVVCGPSEMADEVRCVVSGICRHATKEGPITRLVVECFSW